MSAPADLGYIHHYRPGTGPLTLLLLHGTGGNENDLLPLAPLLAADAGVLSPRGNVLERGMPRFFRRLAEGVFDEEDLVRRTAELARFVAAAAGHYGFDPTRVIAAGFSNGANIAASLLLLEPRTLAGAVLFRAMLPIQPPKPPDLSGVPVFLATGRHDPYGRSAPELADLLRRSGAIVDSLVVEAGHELTPADVDAAREWLGSLAIAR